MPRVISCPLLITALAFGAALPTATGVEAPFVESGPVALKAAKVLVVGESGEEVRDHAWVLVREGRIDSILDARVAEPGADFERVDLGESWLMPGMVDLHSHVGGTFDINGAVFQSNSDLRVSPAVIPGNRQLRLGLASGVTTVLFIPGSATTVGGQGVLIKTGFDTYDRTLVRDPGSLKVAQADNPKRWGYRMQPQALGLPHAALDAQLADPQHDGAGCRLRQAVGGLRARRRTRAEDRSAVRDLPGPAQGRGPDLDPYPGGAGRSREHPDHGRRARAADVHRPRQLRRLEDRRR
ncbi:MAG: hypothetical protein ACYTFV_13760, partial [Planctomycetota bacterium]